MGLLDKLFGKKENKIHSQNEDKEVHSSRLEKGDKIISSGNNVCYKISRNLTDKQKDAIEKSRILLRADQLYMHYWKPDLVCKDRNDPEWQNMVMFFWKAEEPFPKKSLPPFFDALEKKYFLLNNGDFTVGVGTAAPWFGMPGGGEKHFCAIKEEDATIPELQKLGFVTYVEPVELTDDNLDVLSDKDNYFFLIDERLTSFRNGNFYLNGQPISISDIYSIGGIHIVKEVGLE